MQPNVPPNVPPPGGAVLNITTVRPLLAWILLFTPPRLTLNGQESKLKWGENQVPVQPGRYDVWIHVPYLWKVGQAGMPVEVAPGAQVPVYYASPWFMTQPGAIGHQQVEAPGRTAAIAINVVAGVILLIFLICCCINVFTSSN
jgi:hypothetical protein